MYIGEITELSAPGCGLSKEISAHALVNGRATGLFFA